MAIVLAIEPDRRQAAHLTAIVRNQVRAELVLADTTEGALDAIGNRVPDLVLVPALLSPQDDAALAAALRVIAAAAHVRTLTIPVLASGVKRTAAGGMLSKWRKHKAASPEPDGCDPSVFGEQISTYLQEAAAERAQLEEDASVGRAQTNAAPPTDSLDLEFQAAARAAVADIEPAGAAEIEAVADIGADDGIEAVSSLEAISSVDAVADIEPIATLEATADIEAVTEIDIEPQAPAAPMPESYAVELVAAEPFAADPLEGTSIALPDDALVLSSTRIEPDAPAFDPFDLLPQTLAPPEIAEEVAAALDLIAAAPKSGPAARSAKPRFAAFVAAPPRAAAQPLLAEPPSGPRSDIDPWVPMYLTPGRIWPALEGVPAETPAARTEQPDWIELVASLRQDLERRRIDRPAADPIAVRPSDGANAETQRLVKKPRTHARKAKPVQDEWGFFDPEQCGFSTLLAKLEEITEEEVRS